MPRRLLRPHPPLPIPTRRLFRWFRLGAAAFLPAAAYLAWILQRDGQSTAAWSWTVLSLAMVVMSWAHPRSPVFIASLVVIAGALAVASQSVLIGAAGLLLVAVAGRILFGPVRIRVDPDLITRLPPGSAMPGAESFIRAFESAGWSQEGALLVPIEGTDVISTLMLSPDRSSFAEVTDIVIAVISEFEEGRFLLSRNSPVAKMPPVYLTNDLRGARVDELILSHQHALGRLAECDLHPIPLEGATIPDRAIEGERRVVDWHRQNPSRMTSSRGTGPLAGSRQSAQRIEAWRSAG